VHAREPGFENALRVVPVLVDVRRREWDAGLVEREQVHRPPHAFVQAAVLEDDIGAHAAPRLKPKTRMWSPRSWASRKSLRAAFSMRLASPKRGATIMLRREARRLFRRVPMPL